MAVLGVVALGVVEALLGRWLWEAGVVESLLAPGEHSSPLRLGAAVCFLLLRVVLLVGVPVAAGSALGAWIAQVIISRLYALWRARAARLALSSADGESP
jgi:hypothetical protein